MDIVIVGVIVAVAMVFSIRSFVKIFKGESDCSCGTGCCSCHSNASCKSELSVMNKKL